MFIPFLWMVEPRKSKNGSAETPNLMSSVKYLENHGFAIKRSWIPGLKARKHESFSQRNAQRSIGKNPGDLPIFSKRVQSWDMPKVASNWNVQVARISHLVRALAKTVGKQGSIPVQERLLQSEHLTIKDDSTSLSTHVYVFMKTWFNMCRQKLPVYSVYSFSIYNHAEVDRVWNLFISDKKTGQITFES